MKKLIYFTAGPVATTGELAAIAKINASAAKPLDVLVMNSKASTAYGAGNAAADYVAGTVPSAYSAVTVFNPDAPPAPDNLPTTQAVVANGQKVAASGAGIVATVVVNPSTKAVTVTLAAS